MDNWALAVENKNCALDYIITRFVSGIIEISTPPPPPPPPHTHTSPSPPPPPPPPVIITKTNLISFP